MQQEMDYETKAKARTDYNIDMRVRDELRICVHVKNIDCNESSRMSSLRL